MSGAWNPTLPIGPWTWALEEVIERQATFLASMWVRKYREHGAKVRAPKYRIRSLRTASGWSYYWELSPCPACNPPRGLIDDVHAFWRDQTGTIEWCRVHQKFWDSFSDRYAHMLVPASTKPVEFPR